MSYIQGFVVPVPKAKKETYIKLAAASAPIFMEYGAVRVVENWSENTPDGKVTDYKKAVQATADEAVVFSWIEWPDQKTCDGAAQKMESDPRWGEMGEMPFDGKRLIYAGFETIFET
ncbi:DUF1428 domain-containing protein [Hellea balneolensis]|uniref:DUF1428 domain-containing protein n=1 Tax=Hellea balneolensis TaxID=287478 RepID=UPI00041016A0|nr:DUF1428 domain-containing protein [Hellea balneolensis]